MSAVARCARLSAFGLALFAQSCGGERIRLGDAVGPDAGGSSGLGASGAGGSCPHAAIQANEVLWIGDSWVNIPGTQHTRVRDLARSIGAIGPNDDYIDLAASATTLTVIANQYATRESGAVKVKVLIMDGGTWDTILTGGSAASVTSVVNAFVAFLAQVASDGTVEHLVYFLTPELPTIPGVAALRPGLEQVCAQSSVPCHFLDLQPIWVGHPEYTAADGIQASEAGATVIADQIWAIMQQNCIAQ